MELKANLGDPENVSNFSWSPDGLFLARAVDSRLIIENIKEALILKSVTIPGRISNLAWSSDSSYLACGALPCGLIQIFSVDEPCWMCKIDVGSEDVGVGLEAFTWSPNARNILTTAAHYVEITVWCISSDQVFHIQDILPVERNLSFSGSGDKVAVAQFNDNYSTCIGIYSTETWKRSLIFEVSCKDLEEVCWCPDDSSILVRDSSLFSGLFIYSPRGELLKHFSPDGLAPGLPVTLWSPTGQFLFTINHRNTIRVLNGITYGVLLEETLEPNIQRFYPKCQKLNEVLHDGVGSSALTSYEEETDQLIIPANQSAVPKPKLVVKYCWDGQLIALTTNSYPTTVWVWDLARATLAAILVHINCVTDFDWEPLKLRLIMSTGTDALYSWNAAGTAMIRRIPTAAGIKLFRCAGVTWNPTQRGVITLISKEDKLIKCSVDTHE